VIPKINALEIQPLTEFIASIDPTLPVCFLAFRPNFVFENHPGATLRRMDRCVEIAEQSHAGISGKILDIDFEMKQSYRSNEAQLTGSYAKDAGCRTHPRNCSMCLSNLECKLKRYTPQKST
jgi:pyruvate formate lyase activating enzyme